MTPEVLTGASIQLRRPAESDIPELVRIRTTPEVYERWRGGADLVEAVRDDLEDPDIPTYVIEFRGRIIGAIQYQEEADPEYRHASIDIYVDPALHGQGLGPDAVRTLARYLIEVRGHHRLVIDPAADNFAAIRAYTKVGFRPVGRMRSYERSNDGAWHDGVLMDLLAGELS